MTKYFLSAVLLLSSLNVAAAPKAKKAKTPEAPVSVRTLAEQENRSIDVKAYKKTIQASEAQQANVSSFLKLQDPTPELRNRPWFWTFAFKMQSLRPLGTGKVANYAFDLQDYGPTLMPSLEYGLLVNAMEGAKVSWATGLSAHVGYMAQKTDLVAPSGFIFNDTRLTTTLVSAVWGNRFKPGFAPKVNFLLNPEIGFVNYTQTSIDSSLTNFSQQNNFLGLGTGIEYSFTRKMAMLAQYSYREATAKNAQASDLQKHNLEIGTQITW